MADIYTNAFHDSPELNSENFVEQMQNFIAQSEKTVKEFKSLLKFLKSKKIKVQDAKGLPYAGCFTVDEIDTARLKKEGFVIDMSEKPTTDDPTFYIDESLDEIIEEMEITPDKIPVLRELLDEHAPPTVNMEDDEIEEKSSLVNLADVIKRPKESEESEEESEDDDFVPGTMVVDVKQVGEHQYSFNLTVADLNKDPKNVKYNREKAQFEYQCDGCDETHVESIKAVFHSLKTASALISNIMAMIENPKELAIALNFIDYDLRLLQSLVAFDYALSDTEGEVSDDDDDEIIFEQDDDDHEDCDHDHDHDDEQSSEEEDSDEED